MNNIQEQASILTEEQLKTLEQNNYGFTFWEACDNVTELIASHRSLLSANAEQSFEIMKLKEEIFDLEASVILNVRENKQLRENLNE